MKTLKIYTYDKCSTCKKALKFLSQREVVFENIPIVENPPTKTELKTVLEFLKGDLKKLFNTSGVQYREMGMSQKLKDLSVEEAIQLLAKNGKLIKRPFVVSDTIGLVGFNESEWKNFGKKPCLSQNNIFQ